MGVTLGSHSNNYSRKNTRFPIIFVREFYFQQFLKVFIQKMNYLATLC
jgi:hypothetical protein